MFNFGLKNTISIKDTVHGYIEIPRILMSEIIDMESFQRLRYIEQTGMRPVYPSGRHDRFIHSLGVYHLGVKAADCLLENFSNSVYWNVSTDISKNAVYWAKNKVLFLVACLLHDIGHAPFSHALEANYAQYDEIKHFKKGSPHEKMSAYLVKEIFLSPIKNIFKHLQEEDFPNKRSYTSFMPATNIIEFDEENDIDFIQKMIIGENYDLEKNGTGKLLSEYDVINNSIKNCFISMLNGKIFDVDKLDYIIRDTFMAGLDNTVIDDNRLLKSLIIVPSKIYTEMNKLESDDGIFIKDAKLAKHNGTIKRGRMRFENNAIISVKATTPNNIGANDLLLGRNKFTRYNDVETKNDHYQIPISSMDIKESCEYDIIQGEARLQNTFFSGKINNIQNIKIIGNFDAKDDINSHNLRYTFELAYRKGALGVIQNLVYARNYLYLWIYAQHKIVYCSTFLLPELYNLAKKIDPTLLNKPLQICKDADIIILFEQIDKTITDNSEDTNKVHFRALYEEFKTRKYKKSLYKTIDEYNLFYWMFNAKDLQKIYNKLVEKDNKKYGYIHEDVNRFLKCCKLKELVWIKIEYKKSELDIDEILVDFGQSTVCTLSELGNYRNESDYLQETEPFYLFYEFTSKSDNSIEQLKQAVVEYFESLLGAPNP